MQKQKNKLSNLRAHCTALLISKNFNSHVTTEVNLADKSMHAYKIKQHSLRYDFKKYMNRLRLVHGEISQFNRGHIRLESTNSDLNFYQIRRLLSQSKKEITRMSIKSVFNLANILSVILGNYGGIVTCN